MSEEPHPLSMKGKLKDKAYEGSKATHAATKRLREMFPDEYMDILIEEREARGLPGLPQRDALKALRDRVTELEEMIKDMGGET